jgi:hypothetical protein
MSGPCGESRQERFDRHAHECLDLVTHSTDLNVRATFTGMAEMWLKLANEIPAEHGQAR